MLNASGVLLPIGNMAKQPFCRYFLQRPYGKSQKDSCVFFKFPSEKDMVQRNVWLRRIYFNKSKLSRTFVCSNHFVGGKA